MSFLDELAVYLNESVDEYDLYPVDFDSEEGVSFKVDKEGSDEPIADVFVKTNDATTINALGTDFDYDDVYCDVKLNNVNPEEEDKLTSWIIDKLEGLGFDSNTVKVTGMIEQEPIIDDGETLTDIWDDAGKTDEDLPELKSDDIEEEPIDVDSVLDDLNSDEEDGEEIK